MSAKSKPRPLPTQPGTPRPRQRILIVEDHPMMREGIANWINHDPELEVCAEAGNAAEALHAAEQSKPDLVLCDITLAGRNGIELVKDLKALRPELPVVMLSMHDESVYALRAVRAGARGYVMKKVGGAEVVAAVKQVLLGGTAFSPGVASQLLDEFAGRARGRHSPLAVLTDREFEVFQLLGLGKTNREIARQLNLSPKTVEVHRVNLRNKLKLKSTPELIRYAVHYAEAGATG
ncbi:MAG: response regulator transcription factor [Verrucomicrobia bacterium]|jgi:DNA-binding NarL/FixJ family response regulator|nr:response regulator transcription factor [Verrucomicrobiota bacterium]